MYTSKFSGFSQTSAGNAKKENEYKKGNTIKNTMGRNLKEFILPSKNQTLYKQYYIIFEGNQTNFVVTYEGMEPTGLISILYLKKITYILNSKLFLFSYTVFI